MSDPTAGPPGLGDQLRRCLAESGRSLRAIAEEAGVPHSSLSRFAAGDRDLTLATAGRVARVLRLKLVETGVGPAGRRRSK